MKASQKAIELIKEFEEFRAEAYLCPAKVPTIGYGSTKYADGTKVTLKDRAITEDEASRLLDVTLDEYEEVINAKVTVPLLQNHFDALVSFVYNVGKGAFKTSTLLKKLNAGDFDGAGKEFARWKKAGGKVLAGLVARRKAETEMFLL